MRFSPVAIALSALIVGGCATRPSAPPPPRVEPRPAPAPSVAAPALQPADYVEAAGSGDLLMVRASELALRQPNSSSSDRRLAELMIREHGGMSAQLSLSGRRVNLLPPASLLPRHQRRLSELESSASFAADYRRHIAAVHEELLRLHSAFAATGSSPTLRPVARAAAENVRRHLHELR